MKTLHQILAIAHTEFRFGFRRGAPVAVTALIGLIVTAGIMLTPLINMSQWALKTNMTPEQVENWTSYGFTIAQYAPFLRSALSDLFVFSTLMAWLLIFLALLLLPMATSASIPADRQFGVSELLHTTPINGFIYLAGKILGMLATVLLIGTFMLVLFFAVTEVVLFSSLRYGLSASASIFLIRIALMDGLPMFVFGTTIGVLVGIFFRTRRAAIFPGFLAGVASLFSWAYAFRAPAEGFFGMTDIAYFYLLQNYHSPALALESRLGGQEFNMFNIAGAPHVGIGQITLMYVTVIAVLAILASLARLWLQWKENF